MTQRRKESNWMDNQNFQTIILDNEEAEKDVSTSDLSDLSDCDDKANESKSMIVMQCDFGNSNHKSKTENIVLYSPVEERSSIHWPQSPETQKKELCKYLQLIKPSEIKEEELNNKRRSKRVKNLLLKQENVQESQTNNKKTELAFADNNKNKRDNLNCKIKKSIAETVKICKKSVKSPVKMKNYDIHVKKLVNSNKTTSKLDGLQSANRKINLQCIKANVKPKVYRRIRRKQNWDLSYIVTKRKRRKAAINSNYLNVKKHIKKHKQRNDRKLKLSINKSILSTNADKNNCKLNLTNKLSTKVENECINDKKDMSTTASKLENYRIDMRNFFDNSQQLPNVSIEHRKQLLRTLDVSLTNNEFNSRKLRLYSRSPDFIGFDQTEQFPNHQFNLDIFEKASRMLPKLLTLKKSRSLKKSCKLVPDYNISNSYELNKNPDDFYNNANSNCIRNEGEDNGCTVRNQENISIIEHDYFGSFQNLVDDRIVRNNMCLHECDHDYCKLPSNTMEVDSESDTDDDSDGKSTESESMLLGKSTSNAQILKNERTNFENAGDNELLFNLDNALEINDSKLKPDDTFNNVDIRTIIKNSHVCTKIQKIDCDLNFEKGSKENHNLLQDNLHSLGVNNFIPPLKTDYDLSLTKIDEFNFNGSKINDVNLNLSAGENLNEDFSNIKENLSQFSTSINNSCLSTGNSKICTSEFINPSEIVKKATNFLPFKNGAEVRSLHKSLMPPKRKLSDDEWLNSRSKTRHKLLDATSSHSIFISKENGQILNVFYIDYHLFICQEFTVSLWQQTALGNILGAQNMWIGQGQVQRIVLKGECIRKSSKEMVLNTDTSVAYVELWTKEHKSDYRQGPVADVFATVYFWKQRQIGLEKKVIQLENIKGFAKDVQYIVSRNNLKIIVSWYYVCENKKSTNVHAYELAEDFQMLNNVYELQPVNHYVSSLHNIENCDGLIVGCGDCNITLWNVSYGYKVATIDLKLTMPPLTLWVKSDRGFLFLVQEFENMELQLIAINGINHSWKRLASYHPPAGFSCLRGVNIENGILISFYEQGILCWNAQTAEPIVEEIPSETEYIPSGKYVIMIVNDQVIVRHAITHLIAGDESSS